MSIESLFADTTDKVDMNPHFNRVHEQLTCKDQFFLSKDANLIVDDMGDSDATDEQTEMIHRANTETRTLFRGVASSVGQDSQATMSDLSM